MSDNVSYQSSAPATPPAGFVVRTEEVATGAGSATAHVQVMRLGAAVANSSEIVSIANPFPVRLQDSTALVSVLLNSGGVGGSSGTPIWTQPTTTVPVSLTSGSKVQVEPVAAAVFPISGNTTAIVANSSGPITTGNPLPVLLQSSTATVSVQGNVSAAISGNTTAVLANSSGGIASGNPLHVFLQDSTATVAIKGNASVSLTTASVVQVEPKAAAVFPISGNTTAIVGNSSGAFTTGNPLPVLLQSSTATVTIQGNVSAAIAGNVSAVISGNSTAVLSNTSGNITTGNPLAVYLQGSTATVTIQGNASVVVTAQPGMAQINTSGGSTIHLVGGMDGNTSNSTARALKVNTSQELVITGAVAISGNATVAFTTGTTGRVELASGGVGGTSGAALWIQPTTTIPISGNTTAVIGNSSGVFTTGNPLPVLLQSSTATVTVQGNVSAAVAGNVSAVITAMPGLVQINTSAGSTAHLIAGADGGTSNSTARTLNVNASRELLITGAVTVAGNTSVVGNVSAVISGNSTAVLSNTSGNITTANPLAVYLQGSTAVVSIQGNASIAGNVSAVITAMPGTVTLNASAGTTGLLVYGADTTGSGATVRPLRVNSSGELVVQTGSITVGGQLQLGATGGSTVSLIGGLSDGTSNGIVRSIRVNTSGELLTVGGSVTVAGAGIINTTAGSSGVLVLGADGNTTNSTARYLQVNASQELIVKGTIVGNTSVVGNVSAAITAMPGTVTLNASAGTTGLLVYGADTTGSGATVRPLRVNASGELVVQTGAIAIGGLVAINTSGGTTMMMVGGQDGGTSNSTARTLNVNASRELLITGAVTAAISGNTTAVVGNASGVFTTANPLPVYLQGSTATVTVQGNVSAAVAGNVSAVITALPGAGIINTTAGTSGHLMLGADGNTSNSTARYLQVNASQELIVKGTIVGNTSVVGNVSALITAMPGTVTINTSGGTTMLLVGGQDGGTNNSTARTLNVNASRELLITGAVAISGNTTAIMSNFSGNITAINPLHVNLVDSTATVTITADPALPVGLLMNKVYQGTTALVPQYANFAATASGLVSVVASVTGRIVVLAAQLTVLSSCSIRWFSSATNALTGLMPIGERSGFVLPFSPVGWFRTATGEALQLEMASATGPLGGSIVYCVPTT